MKIAGISDFHVSSVNNRLDLRNVQRAEVEGRDIPKPNNKNVYTYVGGFETYSKKSKSENIEELLTTLRNLKIKKPEWQTATITLLTGETFQIKYDNSLKLCKGIFIDSQI